MPKIHKVHTDKHGNGKESPLYDRIQCMGDECKKECRVRQPWMTDHAWNEITDRFRKTHPEENMSKLLHHVVSEEPYIIFTCESEGCNNSRFEQDPRWSPEESEEKYKNWSRLHPHRSIHKPKQVKVSVA